MDASSHFTLDETSLRYDGWRIVAVCFLVATFGWGLGFYGQTVDPVIGREHAAVAVALLTAMAMAGRVLFSTVIDRLNQRLASALSFLSQAAALAIVINSRNEVLLIAACALFGFSVGNLITLPSLIVQREFDPRAFGVLISLIRAPSAC